MNKLNILASFDSAEISDALDSLHIESALPGVMPLFPGIKLVGPAYTVKYTPYKYELKDFQGAGEYIDNVPPGSVIFIDNEGRDYCSTWGGILTTVAIQKKISGTVINGSCRDVSIIRDHAYPVFTKSITMRSGKNRVYKSFEQIELKIDSVVIKPGDIIFADDSGVIVIPQQHIDQVIERASNIKLTENMILQSFKQGMDLASARKMHRYDKPWLSNLEKTKC